MNCLIILNRILNGLIKATKPLLQTGAFNLYTHKEKDAVEEYESFINKIDNEFDIDLSLYKEKQMKRRITSLATKLNFPSLDAYFSAIINNVNLKNEFIDRITINVTQFYRNTKRWNVLRDRVFPMFVAEDKLNIRIWSAACSTGEEAYSIAIMLQEHFPEITAEIIATDIDAKVIEKAKKGIYSEHTLRELPPHKINEYFLKSGNDYVVLDMLKSNIEFKQHDLLKDSYPQHLDLIVCRNVLIYFTDEAKDILYTQFSESLNKNGVLFLGSTEQIFKQERYNLSLYDTFFYKRNN